ncbi:hypothetical protein U1Q18_024071 [Sarracenia purpurea var. burkii]
MKLTGKINIPETLSSKVHGPTPDSDLLQKAISEKPARRKARNIGYSGVGRRLKKDRASSGKRSRPETPLLTWKFDEREKNQNAPFREDRSPPECGRSSGCKVSGREEETVFSARKLAAVLWRIQMPEVPVNAGRGGERLKLQNNDQLGFQLGTSHIGVPSVAHHNTMGYGSEGKDLMQSRRSVSGPRKGYLCKFEPSIQLSNSAMEGATKWDPVLLKTSNEVQRIHGHSKHLDQKAPDNSAISALKKELEHARVRIHELEAERRSSKKKLEHFLKKLSDERSSWRSREHEKIRAIIDDVKSDLNRERKNRQRLEILNSKLVNDLADAKLSAKRYIQDYEKERKARELIEEVCDELAKEIGEDKAEVEALKRESMKLREEVEEERKMLQMAEVWREERVQMKLVDAKVTLEEKYSQMNKLVADLETFLNTRSEIPDDAEEVSKKAESVRRSAASVNIQKIKEFVYEPPNPDDIFSVFEDVNFGKANDGENEQCVGFSPASHASKTHFNSYIDQNGDIEEDGSGWETVSHPEDQGSSCSHEGSDPSVDKICRDSNVSGGGTDLEKNGEVIPNGHYKVSSVSRLWRSCPNDVENFKIISVEEMNGRVSNGATSLSPDRGSGKGMVSPPDLVGQWMSSPDSGNPHILRAMKGCIEWPRGLQKSSLKARLLEARVESQKVQLRQVLNQKE